MSKNAKPLSSKVPSLDLEIEEIERGLKAGCNSSSTHPRCTCPVLEVASEA